jgi:hypothetical protein
MSIRAWMACTIFILHASLFGIPAPIPFEISKSTLAISDLRVFIDFDDDSTTFATWPIDKFQHKLPPDQIARGIRLGLSLWASVLPDMHFRFVSKPGEANLGVRFGNYQSAGFFGDGGRAFRPADWGQFDMDCGRKVESKRSNGSRCSEWENNIITLNTGRWAVKGIDYQSSYETYSDFAWIFNPKNPHYQKNGGPCRDGLEAGTVWNQICVPFVKSPYFNSLAGCDLAAIIQHEFGHTLLGDHTTSPYECVDYNRRPILSPDSCTRLSGNEFSTLFPGDGVDSWWNRRGVFEGDAKRLKLMGYHTSYPLSGIKIILARRGKKSITTLNWREAQRAMIWPLQARPLSAAQAAKELFVIDLLPVPVP